MNGAVHVLAYADNVNLTGDDIRTIERNADILLNSCKDTGQQCRYMEIRRHQGMVVNNYITIGSNSYEKIENL